MLLKKAPDIRYSEVTPKKLYLNRRQFIGGSAALAACALAKPLFPQDKPDLSGRACPENLGIMQEPQDIGQRAPGAARQPVIAKRSRFILPEDKITPSETATGYVNFYEFSTGKREPKELARNFRTRPWSVAVEGLVKKPRTFNFDELIRAFSLEERIYRWRCVEAWSMVIPWIGFPLADFVKACEPTSQAKFIEFMTLLDPGQMPGQRTNVLKWPYVEGLRLDEAMHPLALLAVGMYDEFLPPQNGAPIRLVVPWKYGFKSIKSIVKVRFVEKMPRSAWMRQRPEEYGFYANVNPLVSHPRWSQEKERRIGEDGKRPTIIFNGYEEQVGSLYSGMNLERFY
jgi:sulfoxide reductase catalytic subunit YedY